MAEGDSNGWEWNHLELLHSHVRQLGCDDLKTGLVAELLTAWHLVSRRGCPERECLESVSPEIKTESTRPFVT